MYDFYPVCNTPCSTQRPNSRQSNWIHAPEYGEYYSLPEEQLYPFLTPVYNGEVLNVRSDFVHASLSGISIKHYYGKCYKEEDEEEEGNDKFVFGEDYHDFGDWFDYKESPIASQGTKSLNLKSSTESGSFEYRDSVYVEGQPLCTLPRINHRNSFWNIHRPELCKLTWKQKYVGASTVIEHLHEHLTQHGLLCEGFHTEEDREFLLTEELDEYVRLKVLASPRALPPDEPLFNFKGRPKRKLPNPKCKYRPLPPITIPLDDQRCMPLSDDEDEMTNKTVRRSKEEFCLTIGKHMREPPVFPCEESFLGEESSMKLPIGGEEEEEYGLFYYNWYLYGEEDYQPDAGNDSETTTLSDSVTANLCPPQILDEFCRAGGKVDFSDLRCNPDF